MFGTVFFLSFFFWLRGLYFNGEGLELERLRVGGHWLGAFKICLSNSCDDVINGKKN